MYVPHLSNPRSLSCCSILVPCHVLPHCLCTRAFVQVAACASTSTLTCTASIQPSLAGPCEYTTIPAKKGAVSVRERAGKEAALCVSCALVLLCICGCHCGCVPCGAAPPLPRPPPSLVAAPVLCSHMRAWRVSGLRCREARCHVRPRPRPRLRPFYWHC